ncbi:MAG TPA: hypothetical protein ENN07_06745 [candidate division Zixibacteria bacterium]|nr:hypothetical protein [candidate division Zixibacteria bacterium]
MKKLVTIAVLAVVVATTIAARTGVVVWETINLREGPGTRYHRLGNFEKGKYFAILGQEGNWVEVNANGIHGYFYKDGIKEVKTLGTYIVREDEVLFRWGPGERFDTLAIREGGIAIEVVWEHGQYLFGQFNGSGVWFNRDAVIKILPSDDEVPGLESPLVDDIPELPEIPEVVVPAVEKPPVRTEPTVQITRRVPEPPPKTPSRWRWGAMVSANNAWVHSEVADPLQDISIPTITIGEDYRQSLLGGQFRAHVGFSPGKKRRWEIALLPSVAWTPKSHIVNIHGENHTVTDEYLRAGGELGLAFKPHRSFALGIGGGCTMIEHEMRLSSQNGTSEQVLMDGSFLAPMGFFEFRIGAGALKTVAGASWTQWISDNTRFFVERDGTPIPIGGDVNRESFEVYIGLMLSK